MDKWSRKKMKAIGKARVKGNYWKCVLVGAILLLITGAGSATSSSSVATTNGTVETTESTQAVSEEFVENELVMDQQEMQSGSNLVVATTFMIIVVILIFAIAIAIAVFILNPITVGCYRFFYRNLEKNAEVKEVCYPFDRRYKTIVKTMFARDLYTVLWSFFLIIPGIVKYYEYSMIPYILSENETMTKEDAFAESKRLMTGNKWRAFVLDLSFIPWLLLSGLTFGIVGVLYTGPYIQSTGAAFYQALKEEHQL